MILTHKVNFDNIKISFAVDSITKKIVSQKIQCIASAFNKALAYMELIEDGL